MATKAPAAGPALKISVRPFTGELPKRKGPAERNPTPFDDLFGTLVAQARKGRSIDGKKEQTSEIMLAAAKYDDPKQLKPITNQLRSALKLHNHDGAWGVRTWVVDDGLAFQVGPKTVRTVKPKADAEDEQMAS